MFAELAHKFSIRFNQNKLSKVEMGEARVLYLTWAKHNQLEGKIWEAHYHEVMAWVWSRRIERFNGAPGLMLQNILDKNPRPVDPREKNFLAKVKKLLKIEQAKLESKPKPLALVLVEKGLVMSTSSARGMISKGLIKVMNEDETNAWTEVGGGSVIKIGDKLIKL